jgi:hypothetical protein
VSSSVGGCHRTGPTALIAAVEEGKNMLSVSSKCLSRWSEPLELHSLTTGGSGSFFGILVLPSPIVSLSVMASVISMSSAPGVPSGVGGRKRTCRKGVESREAVAVLFGADILRRAWRVGAEEVGDRSEKFSVIALC